METNQDKNRDYLLNWFKKLKDVGNPAALYYLHDNLGAVLALKNPSLTGSELCVILEGVSYCVFKGTFSGGMLKDARSLLAPHMQEWSNQALKVLRETKNKIERETLILEMMGNCSRMLVRPHPAFCDYVIDVLSRTDYFVSSGRFLYFLKSIAELSVPLKPYQIKKLCELVSSVNPEKLNERTIPGIARTLAMLDAVQRFYTRKQGHDQNLIDVFNSVCKEDVVFRFDFSQVKSPEAKVAQIMDGFFWFNDRDLRGMHYPVKEVNDPNRSEARIMSVFRQAGASIYLLEPNFVTGKVPDFALAIKRNVSLVEIDGPSHFVLASDGRLQFDGSTILQSYLDSRREMDAPFIRIPKMVYDVNQNNSDFWQAVISVLGEKRSPGVYFMNIQGKVSPFSSDEGGCVQSFPFLAA